MSDAIEVRLRAWHAPRRINWYAYVTEDGMRWLRRRSMRRARMARKRRRGWA